MGDLTTIAAVKAYIGKTDDADDAALTSLVTAYSQWVRSWTNRDFDQQAYTITRPGNGQRMILVPQFPIVSVQSVSVGGIAVPASSGIGVYGYRFTDRAVILDGLNAGWGPDNITIAYTAGYATIPADIAQAVNELVALRYRLRDKLEWSSKSLAGETVTLNTKDMPASVSTVLGQYASRVPL